MNDAASLVLTGAEIDPSDYVISLVGNSWHIIPYLAESSQGISTALSSLSNLILVKNSAGEIYYPTYSINQIGNMNPGEAYQISVSQSETFTYPSTPIANRDLKPVFTIDGPSISYYFNTDVSQTGNSSVIVIENKDLPNGEFAAITDEGLIVGVGEFIDHKAVFTIWGDNEITPEIDGAKTNDEIKLRYYNTFKSREELIEITQVNDLLSGKKLDEKINYSHNAIWQVEVSKVTSIYDDTDKVFGNTRVYPNPVKSNFYLTFTNEVGSNVRIHLIDGLGRERRVLLNKYLSSGSYTFEYERLELENGIYFIEIIMDDAVLTHKVILAD